MSNVLNYRALATFSKSQVWKNTLKPELESIKLELSNGENDSESLEKAAIRDLKRSTINKVINRIIRIVERADKKVIIKR